MEIFSEHVRELWNKWELRVLVLVSLSWQIILIIFGSRRKCSRGSVISSLVWVTYLSADWLATVSLGTLANSQGDVEKSDSDAEDSNHVIKAMWAPFLLLHLGGPDTITAYSLEDNSLWLRHLLGFLVHVTVALYIFLRSFTTTNPTLIAIPVFVSGIIKYIERTWVLRSASIAQFEDSLLSTPTLQARELKYSHADSDLEFVHKGYSQFPLLKRLYANLSLRFAEGQRSYSLMVMDEKLREEARDTEQRSYEAIKKFLIRYDAFKLVEVQLGFLYDVLYTKATIIYSLPGLTFRFITVFFTVSALTAFIVFTDNNAYSRADILVTYVLFIGAVSLELYAFVSLLLSDWTMRWLTKNDNSLPNFIYSAISNCRSVLSHCPIKNSKRNKRWSESMAQQNLISFCLKNRVIRCIGTDVIFKIYFTLELHWQRKWKDVDIDLKALIFQQLLEKQEIYNRSGFKYDELKKLLSYRGNEVLRKNNCLDMIGWSVEVEFDHSILLWHVATDICYYYNPENHEDANCKASKKLSEYMLYVLLMRPFMLPKWIDRITHVRDTFREAISIFHRRQFPAKDAAEACKMLIQLHTKCQPLEQVRKEKCGKSVLLDGCRLASQLQKLGYSWEMICQVWIEMLTYAASQCEWGAHAQQLRRGGELLTHVCLLMADLGLNEQFDLGRQGPPIESQNDGWGWVRSKVLSHYEVM